jgi:hypothetical protein
MPMSKAKRTLSVLSLALMLAGAGRASAQCRSCDPFFHCIASHPGALLCVEGPYTCAMFMGCFADDGGSGRLPDGPGDEFLTTWTLFDAEPASTPGQAALRAVPGALALGDEARASLGVSALRGAIADAALAHGRDWAVLLVDVAGDGFALKRAVEGARVRIEVRAVRGNVAGPLLAGEALGERDQLSVPVRVEGHDRVLVVQAANLSGTGAAPELARIRRALLAVGRTRPARPEPLLHMRAQ